MVRIADNAADLFADSILPSAPQRQSLANEFAYPGPDSDAATPLQYNRARWFDSTAGVWLSTDDRRRHPSR